MKLLPSYLMKYLKSDENMSHFHDDSDETIDQVKSLGEILNPKCRWELLAKQLSEVGEGYWRAKQLNTVPLTEFTTTVLPPILKPPGLTRER